MRKQELHPLTAVLNQKQKMQSKKAKTQALLWLEKTFPQVFNTCTSIRPLKIGIMADILLHAERAEADGISRSKLREAVVIFTRRMDYLTCLKAREQRVDLEGNPVNLVTEEEALHAASKIKKRVEKTAKNVKRNATKLSPPESKFIPFPNYPVHQDYSSATEKKQVLIKHKATRIYDPSAVARLKEKLGLSR